MDSKSSKTELEQKIKHLKNALQRKEDELERIISVFLNHVPHEIRTPLNVITGFSYLLSQKKLSSGKEEEYLKYLNNSSNELIILIENLIDLSMLKSDQIKIHEKEFSITELFDDLYAKFLNEKIRLGKHDIALLLSMPVQKKSMIIHSDQVQLEQIFTKLLQNAFRFTEKGIIEYGCSDDDNGTLSFFVKDSGCGIDKEEQNHIFNSFIKNPGPPSEKNRGLGLGLAVAKGLVELLGGKIQFNSNKGQGSFFSFNIPKRLGISSKKVSRQHTKSKEGNNVKVVGRDLVI